MNKLTSVALAASFFAVSALAFSVEGEPKVTFTGYKLANKTAVLGTFKTINFKSQENANFADFLKSFEFKLEPKDIDTKLPDRDKRIGIIFDGKAVDGKIVAVNGDDKAGEMDVELSINGNSKIFKTKYEVQNGKLVAKFSVDLVNDLKLNESFDKFAAAAKPFHGGKSYPDVDVGFEAVIK
ncbi:hypothetical protein [Campylobacter concisus]|uniref:hypothetical protein n=1 Tax=Campylobacter concisus TaxID=199 RepID=UPI000D307D17|nr:hypothetical protein [Campylobacter concisus]